MNISVFLSDNNVSCWNFSRDQLRKLTEALPGEKIRLCSNQTEFEQSLKDVQIALIWYFKQEWIEQAPLLEWIVTPAAGRDFFKVSLKPEQTISYCSFHGEIIAETVLAMILAEVRGIRKTVLIQKNSPWPRDELSPVMTNLRGSRMTILGFGHIGEWIARLARPFGVRITGIKRTVTPPPPYFTAEDRIAPATELDAVLPGTDHLVLALPSDTGTDNLIDKQRLALLPRNAVIYNVGRGNSINEDDLAMALSGRKIRAAYLDVFQHEPLASDSPLRRCDNCFLMPHASAIAPNYLDLFLNEFIGLYRGRYMQKNKE